jgi:pimeloyl-ACP methyl ester carboxylesterase
MSVAACQKQVVNFEGAERNVLVASVFSPPDGLKADHPPVLFMHGGGQTRHSWDGAAQRLAMRGNLTITVDARGHGDSDWVPSQNYAFQYYGDDLLQIARQTKQRFGNHVLSPVLVGASLGGISAMLAQARIDDQSTQPLFSAIILVDITPRMESSGVDKILGFMSKDVRRGFATVEEAADAIASYLPDRNRPRTVSGLAKNLKQRGDGRWYWHWDPAFVDGPNHVVNGIADHAQILVDAAAGISVPTLLIRGAKSELVTRQAVDEFLALVPHAQFVDIHEAGHMVAGDKNDIFTEAVIEFLDGEGLG